MDSCRDTLLHILIGLIVSICNTCSCQECPVNQYLGPRQSYRLNNPGFPNYYNAGTSCSWYLTTRSDYYVKMNCHTLEMPSDSNGCYDYLIVSTTGDIRDGRIYCRPFSVTGNQIRMQLVSSQWAWGGVFSCDLTTELIPTTTPNQTTNCQCGWSFTSRIVGGTNAGVNEFPSMALILNVPIRSQWCGATIIAPNVALTAGHCFVNDRNPNSFGLLVGEHDTSTRTETNATVLYKIKEIIIHDNYLPNQGGNDIALLRTTNQIVYSARVGPACLPFNINKNTLIRKTVIVTGWGTTSFGGEQSSILQKVNLDVIPDDRCVATFKEKYKPPQHLCTFTAGKDACQFDSGGPLYYFNYLTNRFTIAGIVSFGVQCAGDDPAVNINVNYYIPWILRSLPDVQFCNI